MTAITARINGEVRPFEIDAAVMRFHAGGLAEQEGNATLLPGEFLR